MISAAAARAAGQRKHRLLGHIKMKCGGHMVHEVKERWLIDSRLEFSPAPHTKGHEKIGSDRMLEITGDGVLLDVVLSQ